MYSPKISPDQVVRLHKLKHSTNKKNTMTQMVKEAIEEYLKKQEVKK